MVATSRGAGWRKTGPAPQAEHADRHFSKSERYQRPPSRQRVSCQPARHVADSQATHERGDNERRRVHIGAREQHEHPLPHNLIDEGGKARQEERHEGDDPEGALGHGCGVWRVLHRGCFRGIYGESYNGCYVN